MSGLQSTDVEDGLAAFNCSSRCKLQYVSHIRNRSIVQSRSFRAGKPTTDFNTSFIFP